MVSLRKLATAALVPLASALTPAQIVQNIRTLTTKSQALQAPASSITILNAPLIVIGQGPFPQLIVGFADIVTTATGAITAMNNKKDIITDTEGATAIADALREFVRFHQALLNVLIGKAGILTQIPVIGGPVATALRGIEGVVDTIALGLIDIIDPAEQRGSITSESNSLHGTIEVTIKTYDGLQLREKTKRDFIA